MMCVEYTYVSDANTNFLYSSKNNYRICRVAGCGKLGHDVTKSVNKLKGRIQRRPLCSDHYYDKLCADLGKTKTQWRNSYHSSRYSMKDYCENVDGRLGFKCTTTIFKLGVGMLEVDHKNGVPFDESPSNFQTLCKCCHAYKSNTFKDYATIGRKSLKKLNLTEDEKAKIIAEANIRYAAAYAKFAASNNVPISATYSNASLELFIKKSKKSRKLNNYIKDDGVVTVVKW